MSVLVSGATLAFTAGVVPPVAAMSQSAITTTSLVFDGVTVVDVEQGKLLPAQRVVIVGNRIQAVGDTGGIKLPKNARVVDARGKYLIPGLWDMHTHPGRETDFAHPMYIVNGVTGIRDPGSQVPIDSQLLRRQEILTGTRVGPPRQILSGQSIQGPKQGCRRTKINWPETCVADSADARYFVDSLKKAGIWSSRAG